MAIRSVTSSEKVQLEGLQTSRLGSGQRSVTGIAEPDQARCTCGRELSASRHGPVRGITPPHQALLPTGTLARPDRPPGPREVHRRYTRGRCAAVSARRRIRCTYRVKRASLGSSASARLAQSQPGSSSRRLAWTAHLCGSARTDVADVRCRNLPPFGTHRREQITVRPAPGSARGGGSKPRFVEDGILGVGLPWPDRPPDATGRPQLRGAAVRVPGRSAGWSS
jgi:hypothetical protein